MLENNGAQGRNVPSSENQQFSREWDGQLARSVAQQSEKIVPLAIYPPPENDFGATPAQSDAETKKQLTQNSFNMESTTATDRAATLFFGIAISLVLELISPSDAELILSIWGGGR